MGCDEPTPIPHAEDSTQNNNKMDVSPTYGIYRARGLCLLTLLDDRARSCTFNIYCLYCSVKEKELDESIFL